MGIRDRVVQQRVTMPSDPQQLVRVGAEVQTSFDADPVWAQVVKLYKTGLHPAIALCIHHRGQVVLDRSIGHIDNPPGATSPGEIASPDTLFSLFSASKILTAMVIHSLVEEGLIDLDAAAAEAFPEFARHGKGAIRIRHLLNHTAGIADMPAEIDQDAFLASGRLPVAQLADLIPSHPPGARVTYHPMTSWLVLQEIVERVTGSDLQTLLHDRLLAPLGFENLRYGVAPEDTNKVAKHASTGPAPPRFMARIFSRTIGVEADQMELTNGQSFLTGIHPSANIIGTAREASRFMQMLLAGGKLDGVRVLQEATIKRAITEVTPTQLDGTFGLPMSYGLGTMMGGRWFSMFGTDTQGAFGHLGMSNVVVYADPRRELAVAFLNSGKPMLAPGMIRWASALQHIIRGARSTASTPSQAPLATAAR